MENQEEFTRFWTAAQPKLTGYIDALMTCFQEAESLLQNVAVNLQRKLSKYDAQRPFIAWAIGNARRQVMLARRRYARSLP
jgi:RNA polymerase sigma-70 factor (ECF subfamily)